MLVKHTHIPWCWKTLGPIFAKLPQEAHKGFRFADYTFRQAYPEFSEHIFRFFDITNSTLWYKNKKWYQKIFCDIKKSILWHHKIDLLLSNNHSEFLISQNWFFDIIKSLWFLNITKSILWYQNQFCDIKKYEFVISQNQEDFLISSKIFLIS